MKNLLASIFGSPVRKSSGIAQWARPNLETLEDRMTPAASVFLNNGSIFIVGDNLANNATVTSLNSYWYRVTVDDVNFSFYKPSVWTGTVVFYGNDGDDVFRNTTVLRSYAYGHAGNDYLYGSTNVDNLNGGAGNDYLDGGAGNDLLFGGLDADNLAGQAGNDYLYGGAGINYLDGGAGNDVIYGGLNADELFGQDGNDSIYGGGGGDYFDGGAGNDVLVAALDFETNTFYGGTGDDYLYGGNGTDYLYGGAGNDVLFGKLGKDYLFGEAGNDYLSGGRDGNADYLSGGTGYDRFVAERVWNGVAWVNLDKPVDFHWGDQIVL